GVVLTNFKIDGLQDELIITEDEQKNVTIECSAYGRPAPNIILFKNGMEVQRNTINSVFDFNQTVSHTLTPAKCEDFGKPRHRGSVPWRLDKNGFTLSIVANPPLARDSVRVDSEGTNVSHWFKLRQTQKTLVETTLFVSAADFWTLAVDISMHPDSFRIVIGFVIVLHGVIGGLFVITVFMWRKPNTKIGRSNPAFQINDQQPNLHDYTLDTATNDTKDGGSDPGYASTSEITTTPLKGQGSTTAPTSDRDQFGYSCPRDQIPAGDSQSRKASGVPFYAEAGVGNATVAMRDGENRQPGPHVSTISIAPNGDVYNVVSKRAMGDNTAGVRNKEPAGTRRNDMPLGEDNYDHLTNKVRQTPAATQGDPQYSHVGQF
ncbi:hypothetical protein BaRGS_00038898, partial [Batillaria attramentaria]